VVAVVRDAVVFSPRS